jgi:virginiamycin B lyase
MISVRRKFGWTCALAVAVGATTLAFPTASGAVVPPPLAGPPRITEYQIPPPPAHPHQMTHGPDGNVWFTDLNNASVDRVTPDGRFRKFPVPDSDQFLRGITDGPDGALWFAEEGTCINAKCSDFTNGKIGRITTTGRVTEYPVPSADSHPWEITHGPDGNLWFTELGDNLHGPGKHHHIEGNRIGRITPQGQITEFPIPTFDSFPDGITTGPDGALWFTENTGNNIGRITTSGHITEFPIPTPNSRSIGIRTGLDGNLWFTEQIGQKIGRITPKGRITEFPLPNAGNPVWITLGPDGAMWFTEVSGQRIGRITSDGKISEIQLADGSFPLPITIGPHLDDVWFGEVFAHKVAKVSVCDAVQFRVDCALAAWPLRDPRNPARP